MEPDASAITPVLTVRNATEAIAFYHRAFGAEEVHRNVGFGDWAVASRR